MLFRSDDGGKLAYFLAEKDTVLLEELPLSHQNGYVAIVIGATGWTKKLPYQKLVELCKKVNQPIILLGGKEEVALAEMVEKSLQPLVFNACNQFSLNQSVYLGKEALYIIGQDTGLTHILASFDKQIFGIYGGTVPQHCYPYTPNRIIIQNKQLACRPCSRSGKDFCPKGHFKCMQDLDFEEVKLP